MPQVGQAGAQLTHHLDIVKAANAVRYEQDLGFGIAQNEPQFFAAINRHHRVDDQPANGCGDRQRHGFGDIGELKGERGARFDAQLLNPFGQSVGLLPRLREGQSNARVEQ